MGFSIHTRVPNILFLLFPLCVFIYIGLYKKKEQEDKNILSQIQWKKYLLGIIIGILLGVLIILLLGKISILFDNVLASLMTSASQEAKAANETDLHSITSIVKKFVIQSSRVGFIFISIFTIQEILILQSKKKFLLIILFVMALISVPFIPKLKILVSPSFHFYVLGLIVFFYYYYFRFSKSSLIYSELFLTLTTIFIAIISSLGSDLGFKTILNSGGIVWPMVLSLYFIFRMQLMKSISYKKVLTFSLLAILVFYSLLALVVWKPYRDSLKGSLQMGSQGMLKGTTSSKDRILVLQDLCDYMSLAPNFSKANLLVLNSAPLLYYMLDKDMPIANEWGPWIFLNPLETIKSLLSKYDSEKGYVILAVSAQRSNWPHLKEPTVRTLEKKKYEYVLSWLLENGYTPVHSNQSFVVYSN
ncbi:hypothetical protein [Spirochaeta cellobiosiphila]|uniref:hypothetical protein n=1 Tax=Spirochaeta cellobiosiphila TaxID=504483 RepID=UPI0012EC8D32|nr:hypothetical protein [Spirochaeta cellobiosiphila]